MAQATPIKVSISLKLNDGLDSDGNVKTVSISLGSLSLEGYDDDKALTVIETLAPLLSKQIYRIEKTYVTALDKED